MSIFGKAGWGLVLAAAIAGCGQAGSGGGSGAPASAQVPEAQTVGGGGGTTPADDAEPGVPAPEDATGKWAWGTGEPPAAPTVESCDEDPVLEVWQAGEVVGARRMHCDTGGCWQAERLKGLRAGDNLVLTGAEAPPPGVGAAATPLRYELTWDATTSQWRGTRNGQPVWLTSRAGCP